MGVWAYGVSKNPQIVCRTILRARPRIFARLVLGQHAGGCHAGSRQREQNMIRVSFANHEFVFKDGDVLGSEGTVDPAFFARFGGIRSRHVVFSETPTESFFLIPEEVDSIVRLDGVRIAHGVQQKITGRHSLILNEAGMLIEWFAENDLPGPNNETAEEPEFGVNQGALGTDLRLLELIVENIDDLIAVIDSKGRRVWNNAAYARVLGYSVDSLAGSNSLIEVHPDDLAKVQKALRDSMRTGAGQRIEYRLRHFSGHYIYLESQGWVLPASDVRGQLLVVISRDISKRKELEERQAVLYEQQNRTLQALQFSQKMISAQLVDAARYVRSQLPVNLDDSVQTDWRYLPSSALGGDALDFFWIDKDHLVVFLLDVVGHGVGPALLAISILHLLRQRALKDGDPLNPVSVLAALNRSFQMDEHGDKVFSIWYGVFDRVSGMIHYAAAGHPPALLISPSAKGHPEVTRLKGKGLWIGASPTDTYEGGSAVVAQDADLYVFSDGLFELSTTGGAMLGLEGFGNLVTRLYAACDADLEGVLVEVRRMHGSDRFEDDASILKIHFG
jgi:sigma-B regulation protein RsbU (phosphoserine phosphatase)